MDCTVSSYFRYSIPIYSRFNGAIRSIWGRSFTRQLLSAQSIKCRVIICTRLLLASVEPIQITKAVPGVIDAGRYISVGTLSATSLFGAIVTALIAVEIYHFMIKHNISIKLPDSVPPAVSNSFAALIPTLAVILLFWGIRYGLKFDVNTTITYLIAPLKSVLVGNNLFGGLLTVFLIVFFWSFGIHGPAILGPIIRPMWDSAILENMEVFTATGNAHQLPNLFTEQFIQWFVWIGGSGSTLALVIMFMFSKSKFLKRIR